MKTYYVSDSKGNSEVFYNVTEAKKWMQTHEGSIGTITKVYVNGEWEPCGEIVLKGRNSIKMNNQTISTY